VGGSIRGSGWKGIYKGGLTKGREDLHLNMGRAKKTKEAEKRISRSR